MAGSNRNLYLAATIASLTAALCGYSVGYISGVIVLPSFLYHFHLDGLSEADLASVRSGAVTIWLLGAAFGVLLARPVCSKMGRQICLQFSAILYIIGAGLQLASHGSVSMFEAGRLLSGLGVGAGTLVSPM
jgi:MFS family permease